MHTCIQTDRHTYIHVYTYTWIIYIYIYACTHIFYIYISMPVGGFNILLQVFASQSLSTVDAGHAVGSTLSHFANWGTGANWGLFLKDPGRFDGYGWIWMDMEWYGERSQSDSQRPFTVDLGDRLHHQSSVTSGQGGSAWRESFRGVGAPGPRCHGVLYPAVFWEYLTHSDT